jgi:hypothetical protein
LKHGIKFEIVWLDQDVVQFRVECSNARFSGSATLYIGHDDLRKMAEALRGFPSSSSDTRTYELGTFDPKFADGGIKMQFYCKDSVGHAAVDVKLRGDACQGMGETESVALRIPVEAAGIDSFIAEALRIDTQQIGATVFLPMAGL